MLATSIDISANPPTIWAGCALNVLPGRSLVAMCCYHIGFAGFQHPGFNTNHIRGMTSKRRDFGVDKESMRPKSVRCVALLFAVCTL